MCLDPVAVAAADLVHQTSEFAVGDIDAPAAARADQMVVMLVGIAQHVGVGPVRQVQTLHDAQGGEQLQPAEDRSAAHLRAPLASSVQEIRGGEVPVRGRDQLGHQPSIRRGLVARLLECPDDSAGLVHPSPA